MKTAIAILALIWGAMIIVPVVAQVPVPFWHWPALYDVSENLVAKRGIDQDGALNGKIYFRIGWGGCLAMHETEWQDFLGSIRQTQYINVRSHAESRYQSEGWSPNDSFNCPQAPMEVKPYWRGSRPVYELVQDEVSGYWVKGSKTAYRVAATNPAINTCTTFQTRKTDGDTTNYWQIAPTSQVSDADGFHLVSDLEGHLTSVCREQDVSVEDHRW